MRCLMRSVGFRLVAAIPLLLLMVGCNYNHKIQPVMDACKQGNYALAQQKAGQLVEEAREAIKQKKVIGDGDLLVLLLEQATAARNAGDFDQSNKAFDVAQEMFEKADEAARLDLGKEVLSAFTTPAALPYSSYGYDRIMTNVYKAANYLSIGRFADARIEIRRIADSQERCERRYRDRIRQNESARSSQGIDNRNMSKDKVKASQLLSDFPDVANSAIEDLRHKELYLNPFAEYVQGIFYLYSPAAGDPEVGRVALGQALGMAPNCRALKRDFADAERIAAGEKIGPKTYIVFETGMAPERHQISINIPVYVAGRAYHVGLALPQLKPSATPHHPYLEVVAPAEGRVQTETIVSIDRLVAREFKDDMPVIVTRAALSAATKIAMQIAGDKATENANGCVRIIAFIFTRGYSVAMNQADLRTFRTLPKEIQIASMPTPVNGQLTLHLGGATTSLAVKPGQSNIVWVRSPGITAPPVIRAFPISENRIR